MIHYLVSQLTVESTENSGEKHKSQLDGCGLYTPYEVLKSVVPNTKITIFNY